MGGIGSSSEPETRTLNQRKRMSLEKVHVPSLREMEMEAEAEAREYARVRLQQKLQAVADQHGEVFPPQRTEGGASAPTADATSHRRRGD